MSAAYDELTVARVVVNLARSGRYKRAKALIEAINEELPGVCDKQVKMVLARIAIANSDCR